MGRVISTPTPTVCKFLASERNKKSPDLLMHTSKQEDKYIQLCQCIFICRGNTMDDITKQDSKTGNTTARQENTRKEEYYYPNKN